MWWVVPALAGETMYVQGSSLNLRAKPSAQAEIVEQLSINTPVEVLGAEDPFAKVKTEDGLEGYVMAEFIAKTEVSVQDALDRARGASSPADRLSWAQRAAAIDPTDEVLAELEEAYRGAGDEDGAKRVARERRWPHDLMLIAADVPVPVVQLSTDEKPPKDGGGSLSPETFQRRFKLAANEKGWLLLDQGPAIRVMLGGARRVTVESCKPHGATVAYVGFAVPPDRDAIAFTREAPNSWQVDFRASPVPEEVGKKAAEDGLAALEGELPKSWVVPTPEGWLVRYGKCTASCSKWTVVDLHVTADGSKELRRTTRPPAEPIAVRDVNGDGKLDILWEATDCSRAVTSLEGELLSEVPARCCPK